MSENLIESLKRYGQTYEIHRCRINGKTMILDGFKKLEELAKLEIKANITDHPEISTIEGYLEWQSKHLPVHLSPKGLRRYVEIRGKEFLKLGVSKGQITKQLAMLTGRGIRQIQRLLPDECKDVDKCPHGREHTSIGIYDLKSEYSFIDRKFIYEVYKKLGQKDTNKLLDIVRDHYVSIKGNRDLSQARPDELIEVLLQKSEEPNFKLSNDTITKLKSLLPEE